MICYAFCVEHVYDLVIYSLYQMKVVNDFEKNVKIINEFSLIEMLSMTYIKANYILIMQYIYQTYLSIKQYSLVIFIIL